MRDRVLFFAKPTNWDVAFCWNLLYAVHASAHILFSDCHAFCEPLDI